jgi:hypothetical protein
MSCGRSSGVLKDPGEEREECHVINEANGFVKIDFWIKSFQLDTPDGVLQRVTQRDCIYWG